MKKFSIIAVLILAISVLFVSSVCFADDGRSTSRGSRDYSETTTQTETSREQVSGRVSDANGKAQYIEEETLGDLRGEISLVEFESFNFPNAGQDFNASEVKLKEGFPGKIESSNFTMYQKTIAGKAAKGDEVALYIKVQLNEGYKYSKSPDAKLNGKTEDMRIHNDGFGDSLYGFVFYYTVGETESIKISEQSPATVEFKEGEDVKLFVKATGAETFQWRKYTTIGGGVKQISGFSKIDGATKNEFVIEKAGKELDGAEYNCLLTSKDGDKTSNTITLKLVVAEPVKAEEPTKVEEPAEDKASKAPWSKASEWAVAELNKANELSLIPEILNNQDLTQNITRKEFAHIAVKLWEKISGKTMAAGPKSPFTDTEDPEILKAYNLEITKGTSATTFDPDALITREQMATMMTRALAKAGKDTSVDLVMINKFADDNEMHDWSRESIYYMSSIEIIKGMGENKFGVLGNATREQALLISERSAIRFAK